MNGVVFGDHLFIFKLLSTEGQSLLVRKGAFSDLDLALDVADCVPVNVFEYRERRCSLRYDGCGKRAQCVMGGCYRYLDNSRSRPNAITLE